MTFKLYESLGLTQNASPDEIKKAYRKLAMQYHPDKGGDSEKFKEISHAYDVLSDEGKRDEYNQLGDDGIQARQNGGGGFPGGMNPHDIFAQMFGGGGGFPGFQFDMNFGHGGGHRGGAKKRNDHQHAMHINLQDVYTGTHKSIRINITKTCFTCKETCHACQGRGNITTMHRNGIFTQVATAACNECKGSGKIIKGKTSCSDCSGKGSIVEDKKVELDIPRGITNGTQIRIEGLGEQKQNSNEIAGDLILHIVVNDHPVFIRQGNDLQYPTRITFKESIVGKDFIIDHFSGPVKISTKDFGIIQSAKKYEVKGKGMPIDKNSESYGNLIIQFDIIYPTKKLETSEIETLNMAFNSINL
jgi:DnaJ family protein A protein 2